MNHKGCSTMREIMNNYFINELLPCLDTLLERNEIQDFEMKNRENIIT